MHTITMMTLPITFALSMTMGTVVRANLNLTGFTGPRGITCTHTINANPVSRTVNVRIPVNTEKYVQEKKRLKKNLSTQIILRSQAIIYDSKRHGKHALIVFIHKDRLNVCLIEFRQMSLQKNDQCKRNK